MYSRVEIEYANPQHLDDIYSVQFNLTPHKVSQTWANLLAVASKKHTVDDPGRFYGFHNKAEQIKQAISKINQTIDVINEFEPIIEKYVTSVDEQDTLNYLHHIFEIYHGLLNQQTHELWSRAPDIVHRALADLNILVHECEAVNRSTVNRPSHLTTWYAMPKILTLSDDDYKLFDDCSKFGTIYLLYTEIGKTLEDLSIDNDHYIHTSAFKPFRHFSADFIVRYYDDNPRQIEEKHANIKQYYDNNKDFFHKQGLPWGHPYLVPGSVPVATLETPSESLVEKLSTRQWVKSVTVK